MKSVFFLILISFTINSCSNQNKAIENYYPEEMPKDFDFVIDSDANDKYDSKFQTLTRRYQDGDKKFVIPLSNEVRAKIYQKYRKIDFLKIPSKFEKGSGDVIVIMPSFNYSIEVCERMNSQNCHKISLWSDDLENNLIEKQKAIDFKEFYDLIWKEIRNTKEFQEIPKSDVFYM